MCQAHHWRGVERWQHTREILTALYNVNRGPDTEALRPEDVMPLPGDTQRPAGPQLTDDEYRAAQARLDELDKDLL